MGKTRLSDEELEQVDELLSRGDSYVEAVLDAFYERKRLRKRIDGVLLKFEPSRMGVTVIADGEEEFWPRKIVEAAEVVKHYLDIKEGKRHIREVKVEEPEEEEEIDIPIDIDVDVDIEEDEDEDED